MRLWREGWFQEQAEPGGVLPLRNPKVCLPSPSHSCSAAMPDLQELCYCVMSEVAWSAQYDDGMLQNYRMLYAAPRVVQITASSRAQRGDTPGSGFVQRVGAQALAREG